MSWYSKLLDGISLLVGFTPASNNPINKFGSQEDVDTTDITAGIAADNLGQVIWPVKAGTQGYIWIDALTTKVVKLISTNANDTLAGTGAQKVTVIYQDSLGNEQSLEVDMAGLGDAAFAPPITGCYRMFVSQSGSSNTNEGDIKLVDTTTADIYNIIPTGVGQTLTSVQKIPTDKKGKIVYHYARFAKGSAPVVTVTIDIYVRKSDGTFQVKYTGSITNTNRSDIRDYKVGGISLEAGDHVFWVATSSTASNIPIETGFDITIEDE